MEKILQCYITPTMVVNRLSVADVLTLSVADYYDDNGDIYKDVFL